MHFGWIGVGEKVSKSGCSGGNLLASHHGSFNRKILHSDSGKRLNIKHS
jgi:hypothetical protein